MTELQLPKVILLDDLPIVIDEPGIYELRNGGSARIYLINDGRGTFNMKGSIGRLRKGILKYDTFNIWHRSGRYEAVHTNGLDIVKKIKGAE